MDLLEQNRNKIEFFSLELKEKIQFLEFNHQEQMQKITRLFNDLLKHIEKTRFQMYQKLENNIKTTKSKMQKTMFCIDVFLNEVNKISSDITNNYQNIITEMQFEAFNEVHSNYEKKLAKISESLLNLPKENYDFLIIEENSKQIENFKSIEIPKYVSIFQKTAFLSAKTDPILLNSALNSFPSKKNSFSKAVSLHEETNTNNTTATTIGKNVLKENLMNKANYSWGKNNFSEEKTHKKMKSSASTHINFFKTDREVQYKQRSTSKKTFK